MISVSAETENRPTDSGTAFVLFRDVGARSSARRAVATESRRAAEASGVKGGELRNRVSSILVPRLPALVGSKYRWMAGWSSPCD